MGPKAAVPGRSTRNPVEVPVLRSNVPKPPANRADLHLPALPVPRRLRKRKRKATLHSLQTEAIVPATPLREQAPLPVPVKHTHRKDPFLKVTNPINPHIIPTPRPVVHTALQVRAVIAVLL